MAIDNVGKYCLLAMKAFADVLATILVPAVTAALLKYLLHLSTPLFALVLGAAFLFTAVVLVRKINSYGKAYRKLEGPSDELRGPRS